MSEKFDVNKFWENADIDVTPRYEIQGSCAHCTLYSYVETNFGGDAKNFICEGTHEYCEAVMHKLKVEYENKK